MIYTSLKKTHQGCNGEKCQNVNYQKDIWVAKILRIGVLTLPKIIKDVTPINVVARIIDKILPSPLSLLGIKLQSRRVSTANMGMAAFRSGHTFFVVIILHKYFAFGHKMSYKMYLSCKKCYSICLQD